MTTRFLVAVDGSDGARRAAEYAAERARSEGAGLALLHVVDWSPYEILTPRDLESRHIDHEKEIEEAEREILRPLAASLGEGLSIETLVHHGHATETICRAAVEIGATQVFTGRRGRSPLTALVLGSVSASLAQVSPVPVTVVP